MNVEKIVGSWDSWATQAIKFPVARLLVRLRFSATALNFVGLFGCLVSAVITGLGAMIAGGILFLLFSGVDAFDGSVARLSGHHEEYSFGGWIDSFFDSVNESIFLVAVIFVADNETLSRIALINLVLTFMVSHSKALAGANNIRPDWREVRVLGRGIRIIAISVGVIGMGIFPGRTGTEFLVGTIIFLLAFNLSTLLLRVKKIVRETRRI